MSVGYRLCSSLRGPPDSLRNLSDIDPDQAAQNTCPLDINKVGGGRHEANTFTKRELELILDMVMIAEFGPASEGDYQKWRDPEYATLERLRQKLWARLSS